MRIGVLSTAKAPCCGSLFQVSFETFDGHLDIGAAPRLAVWGAYVRTSRHGGWGDCICSVRFAWLRGTDIITVVELKGLASKKQSWMAKCESVV